MPYLFYNYFDEHLVPNHQKDAISKIPNNASYRFIEHYEMEIIKQLKSKNEHIAREDLEITLHWIRWVISGKNNFVIGPETCDRIMERLEKGDIPTTPVPPAYIEFEKTLTNFAAYMPLTAGIISRGPLGRITFMTDKFKEGLDAKSDRTHATVFLPKVFDNKCLDYLKNSMAAAKPPGKPGELAQKITNIISGRSGVNDTQAIAAISASLEGLTKNFKSSLSEQMLDVKAGLLDSHYGPVTDRSCPLLPKAARIMLIAADEARKADADYAKPQYRDGNNMERILEDESCPTILRKKPVYLP